MCTLEQAQAALASVKSLRSAVGVAFEALSGGVVRGREAHFLSDAGELLGQASAALREAEQAVGSLAPPPAGAFSLGNAAILSQEISGERQQLYAHLVNSYRWTDKVHEYSGAAQQALSQNSLKRSYVNSGSAKRRRTQTGSHNVPPHSVDAVVQTVDRSFADMKVAVSRPFAANAVVHVGLGHALKAVVAFKGLMIEWVVVKGHAEPADLWTESRHRVFRKVTENAHAAMLHFYSPTLPELAVRSFMTWFHSFVNLFADACKRCGNRLRDALPPTWRDFRTLEPYHEQCKH